jgi:hypothetical protein
MKTYAVRIEVALTEYDYSDDNDEDYKSEVIQAMRKFIPGDETLGQCVAEYTSRVIELGQVYFNRTKKMTIVLYIDDSPLVLSENGVTIKRNANGRIMQGYVVNGDWELRLSDTELYAFEQFSSNYGWGDELVLRNQHEYSSYEEYEVPAIEGRWHVGWYNDVIAEADKLRVAR